LVQRATPQTVTLTNTGIDPLTITGLAITGDFTQTNTCGASVAAGASCTISVTFTPTAPGTRTGTVSITDNAPGSPQIVSLTGTASGPVATLSAATISLGGQVVGTTSAAHTLTLTNSGTAALSITSIATTNGFTQSNACAASLAAAASCTITVTFTPATAGEIRGILSITDNASGSPQQVMLSGTGQDFAIGISGTETVTAGHPAYYSLQIKPLGLQPNSSSDLFGCASVWHLRGLAAGFDRASQWPGVGQREGDDQSFFANLRVERGAASAASRIG
jgi:hypothetical protein